LLIQDVDVHIRKIADAGDPVVLWCAGARTKTLFDWSSLAKLNIKMIVDANAQMQGKDFYGFEVQPPSAAMEFDGKILICNATNPYPIEEFIRRSGYKASQISIL